MRVMARKWKPGDVAMLTDSDGDEHVVMRTNFGTWDSWHSTWRDREYVFTLRPLVVIDPEDREQVERLARFAWEREDEKWEDEAESDRAEFVADLATALREFAAPTPPKPEEPTGLGAVVEDADGQRWVRCDPDHLPWHCVSTDRAQHYAYIAAVRVLSEGVQS